MARIDGTELVAADGTKLAATWYRAARAEVVVLVAGATAVPQGFYRRWACDLADRGAEVLTFDYRGVGGSRPASLRGFQATMSDWGRLDLGAAVAAADQVAGGRPVRFVGHSFGGQALGLLEGGERLAGGVTVGTGWGWPGHQPWPRRLGLWAVWNGWWPLWLSTLGHIPARVGLGDGLPGGVAEEWARWCRSPDYLLSHVPGARERFARVGGLHVLAVSDDAYLPPPAVAAFAAVVPHLEHRCVTPAELGLRRVGHFGMFRPDARRGWDLLAERLGLPPAVRESPRALRAASGPR